MREMLSTTSLIMGRGMDEDVALVTDGRFSGATHGPCIGHVSPEAAAGGPIHPEASAADSPEVRAAIDAINAGRFQQAIGILNAITSHGRDARWYYLSALANDGAGNSLMALEQIRRAVRMDPNNLEYQRAQRKFQQDSVEYEQEGQAKGFTMVGVDPMMLCCGIWCCGPMLCRLCFPFGFFI